MLNIDSKTVDGVLYFTLEGKLNTLTSREFLRRIESELKDQRRVVIDAAKLEYISSAGLRILLGLVQHMEEIGGEGVYVRNANEAISDILGLAGFENVLHIE